MSWPEAIALSVGAICLVTFLIALAWISAKTPPPSRRRDDPITWEYKRTEIKPAPPRWTETRPASKKEPTS